MTGWRRSTAIQEAMHAWSAGRWLTLLLTLAAALSVGVGAALDIATVDRLARQEHDWIAAGGRVVIVTNEVGGGVDRARCEQLNAIAGVEWAFALTRRRTLATTPANPSAALSATAVTTGYLRFTGARTPGVVIGAEVAEHVPGGWVVLTDRGAPLADNPAEPEQRPDLAADPPLPIGASPVAGTADLTILGDEYAYGVLTPVPAEGLAQACIARLSPGAFAAVRNGIPALLAAASPEAPLVADRLPQSRFAADPVREYHSRGTALLAMLGGGLCAILGGLAAWVRRGSDALYRALGAGASTRALMQLTHVLLWAGVGSSLGAAGALLYATASGMPWSLAAPLAARCAGIVVSIALAGAAAAHGALAFLPPLSALKDRAQ